MSAYVIDDISTDWDIRDNDEIIVCHNECQLWSRKDLESIFSNFPEIESCCRFSDHDLEISIRHMDDNISVSPLYASSNFFEFMGYRLVDVEASNITVMQNYLCVVLPWCIAKSMKVLEIIKNGGELLRIGAAYLG